MLHQLLVNASDLAVWANRLDSKNILPELIRRLILATTPKLTNIDFASGEGVQLAGWDGITINEEATAFVPHRITGWELGTDKDSKGKADKDYLKRTADPLELTHSETTYIFVTLRRWGNKQKWVKARLSDNKWKDIKCYDADNIATWLAGAPAVHIWISEMLGKRPPSVQDLSTFWEQWSSVTCPPTPATLLLAGREKTTKAIQDWLISKAGAFSLQADNQKESIAILVSSIWAMHQIERENCFARAVLVENTQTWGLLVRQESPLILIPLFEGEEAVAGAIIKGHQVYLPLDRTSLNINSEIPSRIMVSPAQKILEQLGFSRGRAWQLAVLARRSLAAFRRRLAGNPSGKKPTWCNLEDSQFLLAATLAGAWVDHLPVDRCAIEKLTNLPYDRVENELIRLSHYVDPPVRKIGSTWYVVDKLDVWSLMSRFQSNDLLSRFKEVALEVLGSPVENNNSFNVDMRFVALTGKPSLNSGVFRTELADSLAMLGNNESSLFNKSKQCSKEIVQLLLTKANLLPALWVSLSNNLSLLAESAPEEFLLGVDLGTSNPDYPILSLFKERQNSLFPSSNHPGLLRALEVLAWSPLYLAYTTRLLARIVRLDPGGNLYNRPKNSLREIFLPWLPHTEATLIQRIQVIDLLRKIEPDATWGLMLELLPSSTKLTSFGTHSPVWQDWQTEQAKTVDTGEYFQFTKEVIKRIMEDVGNDTHRWLSLIGEMSNLSEEERIHITSGLVELSQSTLEEETKARIQEALRSIIHHHKSFPNESWAMSLGEVCKLEEVYMLFTPSDLTFQYSWLFNSWPYLLSGERKNSDKYLDDIRVERLKALEHIFHLGGLTSILCLLSKIEDAHSLGFSLAQSKLLSESQQDILLCTNLSDDDSSIKNFITGLARGLTKELGEDWAYREVITKKNQWTPSQQAQWLNCLRPNSKVWEITESLEADVEKEYWQSLSPYGITEGDIERAYNAFLKFERPLNALNLVRISDHFGVVSAGALMDGLEAAVSRKTVSKGEEKINSWDINKILGFITDSQQVDNKRIAQMEFLLLSNPYSNEIKPRVLEQELAFSPSMFASILKMFTSSSNQSEEAPNEWPSAINAFTLINGWRTIPGMKDDKSIDSAYLLKWINETIEITTSLGRREIAEQYIGQMLSSSPEGQDDCWPHEKIRDVLEFLSSDNIEKGIEMGKFNSRGITSRNPFDGGNLERKLVDKYISYATKTSILWPRTSAMLRRLASTYNEMAIREDTDAELSQDFN